MAQRGCATCPRPHSRECSSGFSSGIQSSSANSVGWVLSDDRLGEFRERGPLSPRVFGWSGRWPQATRPQGWAAPGAPGVMSTAWVGSPGLWVPHVLVGLSQHPPPPPPYTGPDSLLAQRPLVSRPEQTEEQVFTCWPRLPPPLGDCSPQARSKGPLQSCWPP